MEKIHEMKLNPSPFSLIASGEKTVELRLLDEKRREVSVGDLIRFTENGAPDSCVLCRVVALHTYPTFLELLEAISPSRCGFGNESAARAALAMREYYSEDEQAKYGVIGIELELC